MTADTSSSRSMAIILDGVESHESPGQTMGDVNAGAERWAGVDLGELVVARRVQIHGEFDQAVQPALERVPKLPLRARYDGVRGGRPRRAALHDRQLRC